MKPIVSIIIPCFNQDFIIEETLKSVSLQSFMDWECLIIDDGSTDNSKSICEQWLNKDSRFKYFYKVNGGLSSARNYGIEKSLGTYLQFLDSDDLLGKDKLKLDIEAFENNIDAEVVYSLPIFFNSNNNGGIKYFNKYPENFLSKVSYRKYEGIEKILQNNFTVVSSPLILSNLIKEVGLFNINLKSNEDWEFWARLFFRGTNFYFRADEDYSTKTLIRVLEISMSTNFDRMLLSELEVREIFEQNINNLELINKNALKYINNKYEFQAALFYGKKNLKKYFSKMMKSSKNKLEMIPFVFTVALKYFKYKYKRISNAKD